MRPATRLERLLRRLQLARGDRQQPIDRQRQPFVEPELLLELVAARAGTTRAPRRQLGFEVLDVRADRLRRFGLRVGEIAEQVQVVDARERARQIVVDELQRAAHRLDADLDEDAGRILDVVARRLNEPRRLPQLREHAPRALGRRRVREERLAGEARREDVGVELRVLLPGADLLELEHAAADVRRRACGARAARRRSGRRGRFRRAGGDSRRARALRASIAVAAEILEQIVVRVNAVERGVGRMRFVEIPEQVVDEMRQRFGNGHGSYKS